MTTEREQFWNRVAIPMNENYEQDGTAPVNPVTVADKFIEAFGLGVELASEAEALSEVVHGLKADIASNERVLKRIRLNVFANNFSEVKASWKEDMMEAFVLSTADSQQVGELLAAYDEIDRLSEELVDSDKRLDTLNKRYKIHVTLMEWARQYVDYDKYQGKLNPGNR